MERDCQIGHGNTAFLTERLFKVSDPFSVPVCKNCGVITNTRTECQLCKRDSIAITNLPFASKLLMQELTQMLLKMRIIPTEK